MIQSSFEVPWFILGSSLVFDREGIRKEQRKGILKIDGEQARSLEDGTLCLLFRGYRRGKNNNRHWR